MHSYKCKWATKTPTNKKKMNIKEEYSFHAIPQWKSRTTNLMKMCTNKALPHKQTHTHTHKYSLKNFSLLVCPLKSSSNANNIGTQKAMPFLCVTIFFGGRTIRWYFTQMCKFYRWYFYVKCFWWYFLIKWMAHWMNIYKCVSAFSYHILIQ